MVASRRGGRITRGRSECGMGEKYFRFLAVSAAGSLRCHATPRHRPVASKRIIVSHVAFPLRPLRCDCSPHVAYATLRRDTDASLTSLVRRVIQTQFVRRDTPPPQSGIIDVISRSEGWRMGRRGKIKLLVVTNSLTLLLITVVYSLLESSFHHITFPVQLLADSNNFYRFRNDAKRLD